MRGDWAVAARFTSVGEAAAARSALDAAGIDTYLANENLVSIDWLYSQAVGSLQLMVHEADVELAREIISAPAAAGDAIAFVPEVEAERPRCPHCGSQDLRPVPRIRMFLLLTALLIGLGVAVGQSWFGVIGALAVGVAIGLMPNHRCVSCGERVNVDRVESLLPAASDMIEQPCPRCGSLEVHQIQYRRLKSWPLLFAPSIVVVLPIWWLLPKRRCSACGLTLR